MSMFAALVNYSNKHKGLILVSIVFISVSFALGSIPSETLIAYVGTDNAFLLMFVLGTIGGLTTFTGLPYHLVLMSFAAGGINPFFLGICTAAGVIIGDSTMFCISKRVSSSLPPKIAHFFESIVFLVDRYPRLFVIILFLYGALSPFSNDFIIASLSIAGYSYTRIIIPLAIGNICFNISIAFIGLYAYDSLIQFFT